MDKDIDKPFMYSLWEKQQGKCAYSGVPMTFGSYKDKWWTASLERKDITVGYVKDNVCFIAYEFNTKDSTAVAKREVAGSSAWTPDKVAHFIEVYTRRHGAGVASTAGSSSSEDTSSPAGE